MKAAICNIYESPESLKNSGDLLNIYLPIRLNLIQRLPQHPLAVYLGSLSRLRARISEKKRLNVFLHLGEQIIVSPPSTFVVSI